MNFRENESEQKLRGGYYTPLDLAVYISRWVTTGNPTTLLEPSCGDGVFVDAIARVVPSRKLNFTGFEILQREAAKARLRCRVLKKMDSKIYAQDFLAWSIQKINAGNSQFDGVLGNPPFIRYQYLPEQAQREAETIFKLLHLPFTKHTNAWVPFVLASIALLKPGGRLGMILPAEIIHVMHAQSLRTYLGETCRRTLIVDPEEIWFDKTLQGAVILFAEKKRSHLDHGDGIGIVKVKGRDFASQDPNIVFNKTNRINGETVVGKWTKALLTSKERGLLDEVKALPEVYSFSDIAKVDVGIVTGANNFFLVDNKTVEQYRLHKYAHPMFGRSEHCPGVIYDEHQHRENAKRGNPTNFIWLTGNEDGLSKSVRDYVRMGYTQNLHTRYKCRIREPWYTVPSVYSTEIGLLKRASDVPRLISNRIGAYTTDTAYRIRANQKPEKLVYCFLNALTALSAELEGRHYGGGVLELVPSEIENLLIPVPKKIRPELRRLDALVRNSRANEVLNQQNAKVLGAVGLSKQDQSTLMDAWTRLRNRRQRNVTD